MDSIFLIFEIIKGVYLFLSIFIWIFFLRGLYFLPQEKYILAWKILMPLYLLLTGIIIWYIIWNILETYYKTKNEEIEVKQIYIKVFVIWTIIWIGLSLIYSLL